MHKGIVRQNGQGHGFADLWAGEGVWPHVALHRMKRATEVHLGPPMLERVVPGDTTFPLL